MHQVVKLQLSSCGEYSFIAITPRTTLTRNGSTSYVHIYKSNRSVKKLFIFDRTERKKLKEKLSRNNYTNKTKYGQE